MKVVVFNGSPRNEGNTRFCLNIVMDELKAAEVDVEYVWMLSFCSTCCLPTLPWVV